MLFSMFRFALCTLVLILMVSSAPAGSSAAADCSEYCSSKYENTEKQMNCVKTAKCERAVLGDRPKWAKYWDFPG